MTSCVPWWRWPSTRNKQQKTPQNNRGQFRGCGKQGSSNCVGRHGSLHGPKSWEITRLRKKWMENGERCIRSRSFDTCQNQSSFCFGRTNIYVYIHIFTYISTPIPSQEIIFDQTSLSYILFLDVWWLQNKIKACMQLSNRPYFDTWDSASLG